MAKVSSPKYDVIVVGAGNAGLCAALSAQENGAGVLVLEKAPVYLKGGNSFFTNGAFRFAYNGLEDIRDLMPDMSDEEARSVDVGRYTQENYYSDFMRVTEGLADPGLVQIVVSQSYPTMKWLLEKGVRWSLRYGRQAYKVGNIFKFWGGQIVESVGGGRGLVDPLYALAERQGVEVAYETSATRLLLNRRGRVAGVTVKDAKGYRDVYGKTIVLACGGFGANAEWRAKYLGPGWDLAKVEGTPFNTGDGLRIALDIGAQPHGHWSGCHSINWDINAPAFGDRNVGALFHKPSYPLGIVVNLYGKRFHDEGADFKTYTYAKQGIEILRQPGRVAFQVFDDKAKHLLAEQYHIPQANLTTANSVEDLADRLGVDKQGLVKTIAEFNEAVQEGEFNPTILDGKHTKGIAPPKSNWAQRIDAPPYLGCAVTTGITFTYGGIKINNQAQVLNALDVPIPGLYAAGELVGGLFYFNYANGSGLMAGSVFGRIAGASAANEVTQ